ncbi:katanin p60 ATPase-containing subunit A-like 2 isoform X2 [Limulus polyphemus]|uniref:Katanin p60 ATPase-containing subunit A-like 2 n=1 Tax=Limulus polyphemus TaxID=6850 RepID=A0ABM1SRF3_LIMPO|nr:katanin p60 ATPase-containing subunit A-like 2 isoform X2 [Limulus polyphemus]
MLGKLFVQACKSMEKEVSLKLDQYVVCDNIDIELILQEYETFQFIKFRKHPRIVKKIESGIGEESTTRYPRKLSGKSSRTSRINSTPTVNGSSLTSSVMNSADANLEGESSPAEILHRITAIAKAHSEEFRVQDTKISPPTCNTSDLFVDGVRMDPNLTRKGQVEISPELAVDNRFKLLKPLKHFSTHNLEWQQLAEVVSKDIYLENPDVRWDDIVGLTAAKRFIKEAVVYPIKYPELFSGILAPWKGLLLYGPPGTGKTLLAKAVATECKTTFFNISASTIVSKWRGDSEKLVRVLFELARFHAPSTIFLDELDSLMGHRGGSLVNSEHEASKRMKTELLIQMDGLARSDDLVFVLAASNIPWELDYAILRRLEKRILVPLPSMEARAAMFKQFLPQKENNKGSQSHSFLNCDVDYDQLAQATSGYSGADIRLVCKEASMNSVRKIFDILESHSEDHPLPTVTLEAVKTPDVLDAISKTKPSARGLADKYAAWQQEYGSA